MRRRRWGRRLVGALALLVLLELALQAAGPLVQRAMLRRDPDPSPDAPLSVLCVGDSNTYGLHVPHVYAYPSLLKARLDSRYRHPVAVTNRGVPGHNTAQVSAALAGDIADAHADLVLILAGINDAWNTSGEDRGVLGVLEQLKLLRLARVLLSGVTSAGRFEIRTDQQGEILVDRGSGLQRVRVTATGGAVRTGEILAQRVRTGLLDSLRICADHGATPVLMTYAESQGDFALVNATIRALAAERGLLLIDHERAFAERIATEGYEALMFNDHHPNLRGYQLMAATADAALTAAGWVPAAGTIGDPAAVRGADSGPAPAPRIAVGSDGRLQLSGPPGMAFQVLCSRRAATGEGFDVGPLRVPLRDDDVLAVSRLEPTFSGRFDDHGHAEASVPARLRTTAGAAGVSACLILLREPDLALPADTSPMAGISEAVALPD